MSGKFSTTNSSLFTTNNENNVPEWMKQLEEIDVKENIPVDLGIEAKGIFAEKQTVYRDDSTGNLRYLEASFNDNKASVDAKIELAKFLSGKYYEAKPIVNGNMVTVNVRIANTPGDFKFPYKWENGKLMQCVAFSINLNNEDAEYPFNKAGLDECLADLRTNNIKTSRKVISGTPQMITLEEIIRRFNGDHRAAMDKARELVNSKDIVGVGSNTYASMYSMDDLFPQLEKEAGADRLPEFHFAPNKEHVAASPHTSAKVLSIDASKTLAELFSDFIIRMSERDKDELLVKADVLSNGVLENADFCFGIENEKVASIKFVEFRDKRITIDQMLQSMNKQSNVLDAYLKNNPTTAKRIYRGIVLTPQDIYKKLNKIANKQTIANIIDNWVERKLINQVNSTTFTTTASFEQLLASVNTKLLNEEEIKEIQAQQSLFGSGIDFDRQEVVDTGIRNDVEIETSDQLKLASLYNELSKHFKNFQIKSFDGENAVFYFNSDTGREPVGNLKIEYAGNQVKKISVIDNNKKYDISKFAEACRISKVLRAYLEDNPGKKFVAHSIISIGNFRRSLANFIAADKIDSVFNRMLEQRNIIDIGNNMYASKYPIAKLLSIDPESNDSLLSVEDKNELLFAKSYFGKMLEREAVIDTGVRDMDITPTEESMLNTANNYLTKHFANFQTKGFEINGNNMSYVVSLFDSDNGLKTDINFMMELDGNRVVKCGVVAGKDIIALSNVKQAFARNDILKKYLEINAGKKVDAPMIMTVEKLVNKLAMVTKATTKEIEDTIVQWHKLGKISQIGSNAFASKFTVEQLLSMSNLKAMTDEEFKERITKAQREKLLKVSNAHIKDNDTRKLVEEWSADKLTTFAKAELNKNYKQYEILDVLLDENKFEISARVTSNGMRSKIKLSWNMNNGRPEALSTDIPKEINSDVKTYMEYEKDNSNQVYKGLISRSQLKSKLSSVIDINNFSEITATLENIGMLKSIDSNTFASEYSITEMVERLSAFNKVNIKKGNEQKKLAMRDEGTINMPSKNVMNTGSRTLETKDKELSPKMAELRDKMIISIDKAHNNKLITAKKHEQLKSILTSAKEEKDLENVWKEFKKYVN